MKFNIFLLASAFFMSVGCNSATDKPKDEAVKDTAVANTSSKGNESYDLSKPSKTWDLPEELKEISGNTWVDKNHLLVIEDLHPNLYLLNLDDNAKIEKTIPFETGEDKKFDIEDVTIVNDVVYALWSHGVIFKITGWRNKEQTQEITTFLNKKNNTEGICYNPVTHNILVACKDESDLDDAKKGTKAVYTFDMGQQKLMDDPFMVIRKKDFKNETGEKLEIFPSAIAVHPITHDIYLLSTKETKCMVRYSQDGHFKCIEMIDKDEMVQPEGICFAPDGTLYISSEGKHGVPAKLFRFNN